MGTEAEHWVNGLCNFIQNLPFTQHFNRDREESGMTNPVVIPLQDLLCAYCTEAFFFFL